MLPKTVVVVYSSNSYFLRELYQHQFYPFLSLYLIIPVQIYSDLLGGHRAVIWCHHWWINGGGPMLIVATSGQQYQRGRMQRYLVDLLGASHGLEHSSLSQDCDEQ